METQEPICSPTQSQRTSLKERKKGRKTRKWGFFSHIFSPCPGGIIMLMVFLLDMCPGAVRASSIFPILSVILLFMGGLCIAASEFYKSRHNIILSSGILFVSAGEME